MAQKFLLEVDAGYLYDFLSIYQVKHTKKPSEQSQKNYLDCIDFIRQQEGVRYDEVVNSKEYTELYLINSKLFDAVELAPTDKVPASYVDKLVVERYNKKRALQERFFPDAPLREQKFNEYAELS